MIRCTCRAPLRARVKRVSGLAGRREEGRDGRIAGAGMGADRPLHLEFDSPMFRASLRQPMHPASFRAAGQAPVAQLDRAPDYGSGGWEFESSRARHFGSKLGTPPAAVRAPAAARIFRSAANAPGTSVTPTPNRASIATVGRRNTRAAIRGLTPVAWNMASLRLGGGALYSTLGSLETPRLSVFPRLAGAIRERSRF